MTKPPECLSKKYYPVLFGVEYHYFVWLICDCRLTNMVNSELHCEMLLKTLQFQFIWKQLLAFITDA